MSQSRLRRCPVVDLGDEYRDTAHRTAPITCAGGSILVYHMFVLWDSGHDSAVYYWQKQKQRRMQASPGRGGSVYGCGLRYVWRWTAPCMNVSCGIGTVEATMSFPARAGSWS